MVNRIINRDVVAKEPPRHDNDWRSNCLVTIDRIELYAKMSSFFGEKGDCCIESHASLLSNHSLNSPSTASSRQGLRNCLQAFFQIVQISTGAQKMSPFKTQLQFRIYNSIEFSLIDAGGDTSKRNYTCRFSPGRYYAEREGNGLLR
jgi:hypothetical protein